MSVIKTKAKTVWRIFWECFKQAITPSVMYFVSSAVLMLVLARMGDGESTELDINMNSLVTWTIVCGIVSVAYNGLLMFSCGGSHYEMLVSGNMKRRSAMQYGDELNISAYKIEKEYRPWKGFVMGGIISGAIIVSSILFGANSQAIAAGEMNGALSAFVIIFDLLAGWIILPFQMAARMGASVNFYLLSLFALIPIAVSGGLYIAGAYKRRSKRLREQEIAAKQALEAQAKPKKINYGGLPGTKPRKRR
ncbi:MAG: hypothetical protein IJY62_00590 [Clostridia bacterium]|nr:hypothetical protein [Clostridia bacterium]